MDMLGKIRRLRFRDGLSISEICRRTGLARNTVKRWLKAEEGAEPRYRRKELATLLTPYEDRLRQWLEADARRANGTGAPRSTLFGQSQPLGFTGSYTRVSEYVRRWRADGASGVKSAFVPLKFALGEAFQFDWSEESLVDRRVSPQAAGRPHQAVREPRVPAGGLPDAESRNALRCPHPGLPGIRRHSEARHLRQHEDRRGQGWGRQAADRQYALCRDGRALLVRSGLLQRRQRVGERCRREERAGQPAADWQDAGTVRFGVLPS